MAGKKIGLLVLLLLLAFGLSVVACGNEDNKEDDENDFHFPYDDDNDDDNDEDDDCPSELTRPHWDFHGICYATPEGIDFDSCITTNPATKDAPVEEMYDPGTQEGWSVFVQYTDNGCDLGYYVHKDASKEKVLEGTECGTGSEMGVFFSWDKDALEQECNSNPDSIIVLNDSLQLLDYDNCTSDIWEFTINVLCPDIE